MRSISPSNSRRVWLPRLSFVTYSIFASRCYERRRRTLVEESIQLLRAEGKEIVDRAVARAGAKVPVSARVPEGAPVEQIEQLAAELPANFIVLGTHGRSGLELLLMGSVAEGVVRAASVPAMVVPCGRAGA